MSAGPCGRGSPCRNAERAKARWAEGQWAEGRFGGLCGTPAQAADLVGAYADAGIQMVITSAFGNDAETLELVAREAIPKFR